MCWVSSRSWISWMFVLDFVNQIWGYRWVSLEPAGLNRMAPGRCCVTQRWNWDTVFECCSSNRHGTWQDWENKNRRVLFCWDECKAKKKSKIHLCFNIGCQHLIPDTKISILKVGGSNQPRRDGGSSMAGFTNWPTGWLRGFVYFFQFCCTGRCSKYHPVHTQIIRHMIYLYLFIYHYRYIYIYD